MSKMPQKEKPKNRFDGIRIMTGGMGGKRNGCGDEGKGEERMETKQRVMRTRERKERI